jgi:hypothetical protein
MLLRERENRSHEEGADSSRSLHRKPGPDMQCSRIAGPTLLQGIAERWCTTEARLSGEAGRGKFAHRDPCGGRAGNCPLYRDKPCES